MEKQKKVKFRLRPTQTLVLGFMALIVIGTAFLSLPIASQDGHSIGFIDALFTATSAVCVTGLVVVNTAAHWTVFGQLIILILIQIGGLGFMTITTMVFIIIKKKIGLKDRMLIQEALNQYTLSGMVQLIRHVILGTLILEGLGALLLSLRFIPKYGLKGIYYGIFHAISAFCNAGFDILGDNSFSFYIGDVGVNLTIMLLIILGGLGFTVWVDVVRVTKEKERRGQGIRKWFRRLTLHTKLVLVLSTGLIIVGFFFFLVVEGLNDATLGQLPLHEKLLGALFQSITTRTAGFNTMALDQMQDASKFFTMLLMFIGGSPAGTAGGVKTVTVGVILIEIVSIIRAKKDAEIFGRRIPRDIIRRALAVMTISLLVVMGVTVILTLTEKGSFIDLFFEAVSGFATVGLTLGQTAKLSTLGKIIMSVSMFIGRLGPVTMAVAFSIRSSKRQLKIKKPEEKVMVG